jgi:hypothetical protein
MATRLKKDMAADVAQQACHFLVESRSRRRRVGSGSSLGKTVSLVYLLVAQTKLVNQQKWL